MTRNAGDAPLLSSLQTKPAAPDSDSESEEIKATAAGWWCRIRIMMIPPGRVELRGVGTAVPFYGTVFKLKTVNYN